MNSLNNNESDVVIIGSGVGGLTSAILLGQMGYKTTIIERNSFPGGLMNSFMRQGVDCPVGIHYFGAADEGELLRQIFNILGVTDKLKLRRLGTHDVLERYLFEDFIFDLPPSLPAFEQAICRICKNDFQAIKTIISALNSVTNGLHLDSSGRLNSSIFSVVDVNHSIDDFLETAGCSKKLHNIISVIGLWSGIPTNKCPASLFLYTLGALLMSAWEIGCTGKQMVMTYVDRALATGADLILADPAVLIKIDDHNKFYVKLQSGRLITCRKVIAAIHPKLLLPMLPDGVVAPDYRLGLLKLEETPGAFCVRLLLKQEMVARRAYNTFLIHNISETRIDGTFFQLRQSELDGWNLLTMIQRSEYSEWKWWHNTLSGNRGSDYEDAKLYVAETMIQQARKVFGTIGEYKILDVSTPLTIRDWVASPEGSTYGIMRSVKNDLKYSIMTRFPVRSLYLVGQSAIAPGLLGVVMSVLRGVSEIVGRLKFQNYLATRLVERRVS